ncbi:YciI family protein [Herbidospora mongoliensis]|uniref:YciI family protein n=1 Tax=Herbidospora mongoliensis TaxID=688067 RepID=UPI0008334D38|nr:YciI family protein [Herbidospora mongoliensis]
MKYMLLIYTGGNTGDAGDFQAWMEYDKSVKEAGVYVSGESLTDPADTTTVKVTGGERIVTDGPFAEGRELLGGYYVIDVPDKATALEWAARCPGSWEGGAVSVRPCDTY